LSGEGLFAACRRAFDAFADRGVLADMRQAAMARCFHWSGAAAEYEALYARLVGRGLAHSASPTAPPRRRKVMADVSLAVAA
jgi:starch synthase